METVRSILRDIALLTYAVAGALLCMILWNARTIPAGVNTALATVNRPGTGTLAEINKTFIKSGDAIVTTQLQERQVTPYIIATMQSLQTIAPHVNGTMDALTGTAQTAASSLATLSTGVSSTLSTANVTMGALNTAIATIPPLTGRATLFLADADTATKGLLPIEDNATKITGSGATIAKDAVVMEQRYVYPKKLHWYKQLGEDALVTGKIAYHFMF